MLRLSSPTGAMGAGLRRRHLPDQRERLAAPDPRLFEDPRWPRAVAGDREGLLELGCRARRGARRIDARLREATAATGGTFACALLPAVLLALTVGAAATW